MKPLRGAFFARCAKPIPIRFGARQQEFVVHGIVVGDGLEEGAECGGPDLDALEVLVQPMDRVVQVPRDFPDKGVVRMHVVLPSRTDLPLRRLLLVLRTRRVA